MTERLALRGLSVRQPFASAIVMGAKVAENRGETFLQWAGVAPCALAIHAGLKFYEFESRADENWLSSLLHETWPTMPEWSTLPRGAFVGVVRLCRIVKLETLSASDPLRRVRHAFGPVVAELAEPVAFLEPLPYRGMLGLFRVDDVKNELRRRYREARAPVRR